MNGELIWIDVETTGLDPNKHEIIEMAAVRSWLDGTLAGAAMFSTRVHFSGHCTPGAQAVNGYTPDEWLKAIALPDALSQLTHEMTGRRFAGQNPKFDEGFLRAAFARCDMPWPRMKSYHVLDLASLAWPLYLRGRVPGLGLDALCKGLGVEPEAKPHSALNGALKALEVYRTLGLTEAWRCPPRPVTQ
jgi:DNA polymerase-3 subunit epsilon